MSELKIKPSKVVEWSETEIKKLDETLANLSETLEDLSHRVKLIESVIFEFDEE